MEKFHYTYKITYSTGKYYIGVRSSESIPWLDTRYVGSSQVTPNDSIVKKEILQTFATRREALQHEVALHEAYDVARNKDFYNQARQTTVGFTSEGPKALTDKSRLKGDHRTLKQKLGTERMRIHNTGKRVPARGKKGTKSLLFKPWYYIDPTGNVHIKDDVTITDFLLTDHNTPFTRASIFHLTRKHEHQVIGKGVVSGWQVGFLPIPNSKFKCLPTASTKPWWYKAPDNLRVSVYGISRSTFCRYQLIPKLKESIIKNGIKNGSKLLNKGPFKGWSFGMVNG